MTRAAVLASTVALLLVAADASAQDRPDFSGRWTLIADADAPGGGGGGMGGGGMGGGMGGRGGGMFGGLGQEATITQDAQRLTITRTTPMGEIQQSYNLDGSPSTNTLSFGQMSVDQVSRASWDGNRLVITTSMDMGGNAVETRMVLSLNAQGNLEVEFTAPGRGGGPPTPMTLRYQKAQ